MFHRTQPKHAAAQKSRMTEGRLMAGRGGRAHAASANLHKSDPVGSPDFSTMPIVVWLAIPIIVFSFNHSPVISQFAKEQRMNFGDDAVKKTDAITGGAAMMLMGFVMFFVFSVVLSLSPEQLAMAQEQNISVLSYLANVHDNPIISYMGPVVAFAAITSSYFGHFLGAHEGLVGLIKSRASTPVSTIEKGSLLFIVITTWKIHKHVVRG